LTDTLTGTRATRRTVSSALLAGAVVLLVAGALAGTMWLRARTWSPRNLAVLPFTNLTGDPGQDYMCEGIASEILSDLVRVKNLNVVSHTSAWSFRGTKKDAAAIAKELGVNSILEGTVQKRGPNVRLDVQLVNAGNGFVMWSGQFDRAIDDLIRLEEEIVQQVARSASGRRLEAPAELARPPTRSPEAYDAYLQAGRYLDATDDPHGPDMAATLYEKALALDRDFALAYAGLSKALWRVYSRTNEPETFRKAEDASRRAMQLNPGLLEARLARAQMFRAAGRYAESIAELGEILDVNPNWDEAHLQLAASYRDAGDLVRAEASGRRALSLRPSYWKNWNWLGALLIKKGDYAGARVAFEQIVKLAPDINRGYEQLATVALFEGNYAEAIKAYEKLPVPVTNGTLASNIATAYFFSHRLDKAERFYLMAVSFEPRNSTWRQNLGDLYARQGRLGPARNEYRQALRLVEEQFAVNAEDRDLGIRRVLLLAKAGECESAARALGELLPRLPADDAQAAHSVAGVHALCGHRGEALAAIRKAIALGFSPKLIREEDEFRSLAGDQEFRRLTSSEPARR